MPIIGLIQGSGRLRGNGAGLAVWLQSLCNSHPSNTSYYYHYKLLLIDFNAPPSPLGPIRNKTLPASIKKHNRLPRRFHPTMELDRPRLRWIHHPHSAT